MKLRNLLVRPFGLDTKQKSTPQEIEQAIRTAGSTSVLGVAAKSADETVLFLPDRHLDTYISVRVTEDTVVFSTAVRYHNRFGRFYMTGIQPFHNILVRSSLKKAIRTAAKQKK